MLINISNIFGDDYDEFIQTESILFEVLEISQSDVLNFEIKTSDSQNVNVFVMFSRETYIRLGYDRLQVWVPFH